MKNAYIGLALTACLSIASTSLLAKVAPEHSANIPAPARITPAKPQEAGHHELENTTKQWLNIMKNWQKNMKKQRPLMKRWKIPSNAIITCYYYQDGHSNNLNFS